MSSVSFQGDGPRRSGRVPLSFYSPILSTGNVPFWKLMPQNGVPNGKGGKNQQIGYWNEQQRWRTRKGLKEMLPSKWHFYYLGTGPHSEEPFRKRTQGVFWVAKEGAKTEPTGLGSRKKSEPLLTPKFSFKLPDGLEVSEPTSNPASRSSSQAPSRQQSKSRDPTPTKQSKSRDQSQTRKGQSKQKQSQPQDDLVAAVRAALMGMGISPKSPGGGGAKSKKKSAPSTPRERSKSPGKSSRQPDSKRQVDRPRWKRVPNKLEDVTTCFGRRDTSRNFGDGDLIREGIDAKYYPQLAELVPGTAALLFDSEISTKEAGEDVIITYHYRMKVPKSDKNLSRFLQQVSAYADNSSLDGPKLDSNAPEFVPAGAAGGFEPEEDVIVEMVDEVQDADV